MADPQEKWVDDRLTRIEEKIDKLSEAMISIARARKTHRDRNSTSKPI